MKFFLLLACLALFVAYIDAQRCRGLPMSQNCINGLNSGYLGGRTCRRNSNFNMWYYNRNSHACLTMGFLGCGGNNNRYCTKIDCERSCIRRG